MIASEYGSALKIISRIIVLIGVGILILAGIKVKRQIYFYNVGIHTNGKISGYKTEWSVTNNTSGSRTSRPIEYPLVEFTAENQLMRFQNHINHPKESVNKEVSVVYDPSNPNNAQIAGPINWLFPCLIAAFASLFFFIAYMIRSYAKKIGTTITSAA